MISKLPISVLLVDDQDLVRAGIRSILENTKNIRVVAEAKSGEDALKLIKQIQVNVVILDIRLPGISGLEVANRIKKFNNQIKILVVTGYEDVIYPARFRNIGVNGYVTKNASASELIDAIHKVEHGQNYINHAIAQKLFFKNSVDGQEKTTIDLLSNKELQVALLIGQGKKTKDIAKQLYMSPKTVNSYRYRAFKKMNIKGNVELTLTLLNNGLLNTIKLPDVRYGSD